MKMKGGAKREGRHRDGTTSAGTLRTMGYFVPGFIIGLCLIGSHELITLETPSPRGCLLEPVATPRLPAALLCQPAIVLREARLGS